MSRRTLNSALFKIEMSFEMLKLYIGFSDNYIMAPINDQ